MASLGPLIVILLSAAAVWWAWRSRGTANEDEDEDKCAHCGYDLRASRDRCPECGMPFRRPGDHIALRDDWPADAISPRVARPGETPTVVYTTDSQWEAVTLREQLEVRGVSAQVVDRPVITQTPYTGTTVGSWRVVVWSGDADLAVAIRDKLLPHPAIQVDPPAPL